MIFFTRHPRFPEVLEISLGAQERWFQVNMLNTDLLAELKCLLDRELKANVNLDKDRITVSQACIVVCLMQGDVFVRIEGEWLVFVFEYQIVESGNLERKIAKTTYPHLSEVLKACA